MKINWGLVIFLIVIFLVLSLIIFSGIKKKTRLEELCKQEGYEGAERWVLGTYQCYKIKGDHYTTGLFIEKKQGNWYFT